MRFLHGSAAFAALRSIFIRRSVPLLFLVTVAALVAACARQLENAAPPYAGAGEFAPLHYYPPPGPPSDPWGPYIREAAARYNVPEQWIRAVMQQESGGQEQAVSPVGAMGLMQVMPETYEGLRERYGLGDDPYDPHNNILAGAAYIREMYDRYGAPGFLAGYNAGPDRVDSYLAGASHLPHETVNYLAAVTPNLGGAVPLSGPFATYAYAGGRGRRFAGGPSVASLAAGCDLNAAYDPNHPCSSLMRAATAPAPVLVAQQTVGVGGCDLSAAYDPNRPCTSVGATAPAVSPAPVQIAAATPAAAPTQLAAAQPVAQKMAGASGCDLDAAYDPAHPCTSGGIAATAPPAPAPPRIQLAAAQPAAIPPTPVEAAATPPAAATGGCNFDAAYDPSRPCTTAGRAVAAAPPPPAPASASQPVQLALAAPLIEDADPPPASLRPAPFGAAGSGAHVLALPAHDWAIQVGAYANPGLARAVAEGARAQAPGQLRAAALSLPPTPNGRGVLYRARLVNLSASAAADACWQLNQRQLPCTVVEPRRS